MAAANMAGGSGRGGILIMGDSLPSAEEDDDGAAAKKVVNIPSKVLE